MKVPTNRQMAFVCGPRQVGKTTLARTLQQANSQFLYRTWDSPEDRVRILSTSYAQILDGITLSPATHPLLVLDEIHKFPDWKTYVKGLYDIYQGQLDILITGSARLNVFRQDGDSLGTIFPFSHSSYHTWRAHKPSSAQSFSTVM